MADKNAENPSMDDILNTIRGVIAGDEEVVSSEKQPQAEEKPQEAAEPEPQEENKDASTGDDEDEDILELTDMIEDGEAMSEVPAQTPEEDMNSEGVLGDIDNMLEAEGANAPDVAAETPEPPEPAAQEASPAAEPEAPVAEEPAAEAEESQLAEIMDDDPAPAPEAEPEMADEALEQPEEEPEPEDIIESSQQPTQAAQAKDRLLSEAAAATSQAVLKDMMSAIPRQKVDSPATRGGTTLEDLVIEAIRPYLSEWMDKHLATIVKQLVEKEIKHLIPRDVE